MGGRGARGGGSKGERSAGSSPPPAGEPPSRPWKVRFSARIVDEDLDALGEAAFEVAMAAIDKKLKVSPEQYGDGLGPPLAGLYKLKASHIRVAYHIGQATHEVWVLMLGDRQDIRKTRQGGILERLQMVKSRIAREADRRREDEATKPKGGSRRRAGGGRREP